MKAELFGILGIFFLFLLTVPTFSISSGIDLNTTYLDNNLGFLDLNDTPNTYSGQSGKSVVVNGTENGLVFTSILDSNSTFDVNSACTVTVASKNAMYTNPSDAVDALKTTGGRVCIGPGTFQLTRAIDINGNNIEIVGSGVATNIRTNPGTIPVAIRVPTGTQTSYVRIRNLAISASTGIGTGTAIDASNLALSHLSDLYIQGYNRGIDFNKNNTLYNMIDNVRISVSGVNSFGIRFNNGANENTVLRTRIAPTSDSNGIIVNTHGNTLYEVNVESGAQVGIDVQSLGHDTTIIGPYLESNVINLQLASRVYGFSLFGGSIQSGTTTNIQDLGADKPIMTGMKLGFASAPSVFGDINAIDVNASSEFCLQGDCITTWPTSGGSGTTYTSGTPATIEVNNDTNTISQNFDGNFWIRASTLFPVPDVNLLDLSWTKLQNYPTGCGAFLAVQTIGDTISCISIPSEANIDANALGVVNALDLNNSLNYIKKGSDGNGSILGTTNQVSVTNGLSRLFGDANVVLSLPQNIDSGASPTFIGMTLSPCSTFQMDTSPQLRFKVDCSSSLITATSQIPTQPGISDIGNSSNRYDDLWITDINATGTNDFKTICIGGDCKTSWPTSVSSDTNCSTSADCNSMYIQKNPLTDQNINNQDLNIYNGQLVLQAGQNIANTNDNIFEIWNQNGKRTLRTDQNGNMVLDGNLTFVDANSFVGGVGATQGRRVRYNGLDYTGNATTGGGNLWISANTYAFAVTGTLTSGLYFDASAPRGFKFRIDGGERFIFGAGSANTDGAIWQIIRNTGTTGMLNGAWYFKDIGQKDMNWQPYIRRNGIENHWNAQVYLGTPKDSTNDANWTGDINGNGDWRLNDGNYYGQLISPGNLVGVSCNTTCGAYSYGGPWTCVEATNITGTASTCSDTTVAHNCLCRN